MPILHHKYKIEGGISWSPVVGMDYCMENWLEGVGALAEPASSGRDQEPGEGPDNSL